MKRIPTALLLPLSLAVATAGLAQRVANDTLQLPVELPTGAYTFELAAWAESALTLSSPPGVTNQLYVGERAGRIRIANAWPSGELLQTPFLDIASRVSTNSENGLLVVAFHPRYASNGYFYVFYCTNASGRATNRVSRFQRSADNPLLADPNSELILIDQRDDAGNHNGGDIHFGPDGYLYVSVGDEGGGNDTHNNSQRIDRDLFAGLLRIDVDRKPGNLEPTNHTAIPRYDGQAAFAIPPDNPLVARWQNEGSSPSSTLRLEFFAIGLRNPWRWSFDSATGEIWAGDVGQNAREEVDIVTLGGNYGWATREATIAGPKTQTPPEGFGPFLNPIYDYGRSLGYSITGGVVYRGAALPELYGAYIFGDFGSGNIFALKRDSNGGEPTVSIIGNVTSNVEFGTDPNNGDVLVSSGGGAISRLVRGEGSSEPAFPANLSETGAFSDLASLTPEAGIYAYQPNLAFWSDHGIKRRWVSVPGDQKIGYSEDEPWTFPTGTIWIKHFDLEMERGNPQTSRRVETRFLVKTEQGAYGISYRWNEAQTEATLAPAEGVSIEYSITDDGEATTQTWRIPSRQQCLSCHTPAAGFALSFNLRQLNRPEANEDNPLAFLASNGFLDTDPGDASELPRYHVLDDESIPLETRTRSYLAVNCVSCHQPNGGAPYTWDARPELTIGQTSLINGVAGDDGGDPEKRLVIRGLPEKSILLQRIAARNGFARMPPIATNELDTAAIDLITRWIAIEPPLDQTFAEWQTTYFGSPEAANAAAHLDPDHDGNSNRLEYLNRTRPLDAQSAWHPQFDRDGESLTVRFPMAPGRDFVIQTSDDLSTWTDWPVPGNPPTADTLETRQAEVNGSLSTEAQKEFLRISVTD